MTAEVHWSATARRSVAHRLPESVSAAVFDFVVTHLAQEPWRLGKPLQAPREGQWVARRGEYRIFYQFDVSLNTLEILDVRHRRDAYRR